MAQTSRSRLLGPLALALQLWALLCVAQTPANFCSTLNTANTNANMSIYQSHGLCGDFCRGQYSYAILNYQSCWCSDYTPDPSTLTDDSNCNTKCPGYSEQCGGQGAFGYLELGKNPAGTKKPDVSSETPVPTSVDTVTIQVTQTLTPSPSSSKVAEMPVINSPSTDSSSSATTPADKVQTVFVTPSNPADSASTADSNLGGNLESRGSGLSTGAIVGIVIGIALVLMLAVVAAFWFRMRRRRQEEEAGAYPGSKRGSTLMKTGSSEMGHSTDGPPPFLRGWEPGTSTANGENRRSTLMPVDPRMDPYTVGVYGRNKSHESINTIHDDRDYSRRVHQPKVLRAVNPDPVTDD